MDDCYLASIILIAFKWAPRNFSLCQGQMISVSQNQSLFSLLGNSFGGDGISLFGIPDLRSSVPVGQGQSPGNVNRPFSERFGTDYPALTVENMPPHRHSVEEIETGKTVTVNAHVGQGNKLPPTGNYWARGYTGSAATQNYADSHDTTMASDAVQLSFSNLATGFTGDGTPFIANPPSLTLNYSICTQGLYPTRP